MMVISDIIATLAMSNMLEHNGMIVYNDLYSAPILEPTICLFIMICLTKRIDFSCKIDKLGNKYSFDTKATHNKCVLYDLFLLL